MGELGGGRLSAARGGQGHRVVAGVEEGLGRDGRHLGPVGGRGVQHARTRARTFGLSRRERGDTSSVEPLPAIFAHAQWCVAVAAW